jgi:hypothetical protein
MLIEGILQAFEIMPNDYPELSFKMTDAIKRFYIEGNAEPARTREKILADIERAIGKSIATGNKKQAIFDEINKRVGIRAVGKDWEGFIEHCIIQEKQGKTIEKFLDWWLADEWQRTHPPTRPDGWFVKWDLAFIHAPEPARPELQPVRVKVDRFEYKPNPYNKPASLLGE